jgi:eukaryotic-like serine/threonine-protein kinase
MAAPAGNDWQRVEALFYAARELSPAARPAFLNQACGTDLALKKEVQSLLDSSDKTLGFLQESVQEAARSFAVPGEEISTPRQVGSYRLLRVLGEGGMGRVYLAARSDDLYRQQVAIKLMHPGLGQAQRMLVRFGDERQILANLNHPNIARLLDGGVDDGLPYLVMEYVDGVAIDAYCRSHNLRIEDRLRLFTTVCAAVEYAHKNLVVHRDLKPGNILVSREGVPKLLDFGIAKLLDPEGGELAATRTTERMMTPEYASPEQVRGDRVTTSTDVYALGVLLYELLCGRRPFHFETASPIEVARAICEQEPTAPSMTWKTHPESAPPDAAKKLSGDLDNIVLMAMRKEPARRYVSVGQLSEDIEAYLSGYPVQARTDTWKYRSGKFVRRHKAAVTAAVVIAVFLVGFSIGMGVLARRAQRERLAAQREAQFLNSIFQSTTPEQTRGKQITGRELLDQGASRVDSEFSGEPQLQATLFDNIGRAYMGLGLYDKAMPLLQRAYDLKRKSQGDTLDTAATEDGLATAIRLGFQYKTAEPLFRNALAIRQNQLGANHPLVAESLSNLGECLYWEEQNQEAETLLRKALEIQRSQQPQGAALSATENYLALALQRKGQFSEASQLLRDALAIDARVDGTDSPNYANSLHNLAGALIDAGDLSGAEAMDRQSLDLRRKINGAGHPDLGYPLNNLGFVFLERGDWAGGQPFLREALEIRRKLSSKDARLAGALNNWARMLQEKGDYKEAQDTFEQSLSMMRETGGPRSWSVAKIMANLGLLRLDLGDYVQAEQYERQALEMRQKLGGSESPDLASSLVNLTLVRSAQHDPVSAEPLLRQALDIRKKELSAGHPSIISVEVRLGEVLVDEGKPAEAEPLLREAVTEVRAVPFPLVPWQIAEAEIALGDALAANGHSEQARPLLRDPESRLKGYPQATLRRQILQRAEKARALSSAAK